MKRVGQHVRLRRYCGTQHAPAAFEQLTVERGTPRPEMRTIKLTGTVTAMQKAFGVDLVHHVIDGVSYSFVTIEVWKVNAAGLICAVRAYYEPPDAVDPYFKPPAD